MTISSSFFRFGFFLPGSCPPALLAAALLAIFPPSASRGQEAEEKAAPADAPAEEEDWLEYYYQDPTPERFVEEVKNWAADGTLEMEHAAPALIGFLSQVMRHNRDEIGNWYTALEGLDPKQKSILHTAMLFSRTTEADELMREKFGKAYEDQKVETSKILETPLDKRGALDMIWGFFYATGSENAIRRIVICFRFEEAPERPEGVDIPEGYSPLYKQLPDVATGMLVANGERHSRVREILVDLLENDDSLLPVEKRGVRRVLSELDPEEYPPEEEPDAETKGDPEQEGKGKGEV